MTTPDTTPRKNPVAQKDRQAKYQAKLDAMTPLQVLRWKLGRTDAAAVDDREIYTQAELKKLETLKELIAAAQVIAGEVNQSVTARLERTKMSPEVGAMLVELKTKTVRFTLPSH